MNKFKDYNIRAISQYDRKHIEEIYRDLETRALGFGRKVSLDYAIKFFIPEDHNPNHYLFFLDHTIVGRAVIKYNEQSQSSSFGIAVNLNAQKMGHGLNIASYIIKKAFENSNVKSLSGHALKFNIASQKLLQKLGMKPNGIVMRDIEHQDYDTHFLVYSISREEYKSSIFPQPEDHTELITFVNVIYDDYVKQFKDSDRLPDITKKIITNRRELYTKIELNKPLKFASCFAGVTCLTVTELLESSALYKYILDEILYPLHHQEYLSNSIAAHLPTSNVFWVSSHFVLNSFSFVMLQHFNPTFSQVNKFIIPLFSTAGYTTNLFIHDYHKTLAEDRMFALHNTTTVDDSNFLEHCLPEIALTTTSAFIFSLPTAISFFPLGVSYSAFTTLSAAASSTINCAYTNKKFIEPNNDHVSAKVLPYVADTLTAAFLINKFNTPSFYFLPDVAITLKQASFFLGIVVNVDQVSKAIIELAPNSLFEYLDSFFNFENATETHTPEL